MDITADIIQSFRTWDLGGAFFSDLTKYPDSLVQYALCEADTETGGRGWGGYQDDCHNLKRRGLFYYAAAWLYANFPNGVTGSSSGEARLNTSGKSVGDESIEYRIPSILDAGNDWLTFTMFGQQFYRLRKRVTMGARAV